MSSFDKCKKCPFQRIINHELHCSEPNIIMEHEAVCFRLSTKMTGIKMVHAANVHCLKGEK